MVFHGKNNNFVAFDKNSLSRVATKCGAGHGVGHGLSCGLPVVNFPKNRQRQNVGWAMAYPTAYQWSIF